MLLLSSYYVVHYISTYSVPLFQVQVLSSLKDSINSEDRSQSIPSVTSGCHVGGCSVRSKRTCSLKTINRQTLLPSPHQGGLSLQDREGEELVLPMSPPPLQWEKGRNEVSSSLPRYTRGQEMQQQQYPCHPRSLGHPPPQHPLGSSSSFISKCIPDLSVSILTLCRHLHY